MKPGRNDPCPCGSGKKYKRCCIEGGSQQHAEVFDDVEQLVAMNPHLSLDELNTVMAHKVRERNNSPLEDFCGLSSTQMSKWLYAPFDELTGITVATPDDLSASPVMRYLTLILEQAMHNNGSFKATSKGNLPAKLVKQASDLLPEFAVYQFHYHNSISEFTGSNEDKFNALHYTRLLAEIAGIIYRRSGHYHVKKTAQKQYQKYGVQAFFKPMLSAAVSQYNWAYFDYYEHDIDLRTFWVFMLWRLQRHGCVDKLTDELVTAFPDLLRQVQPSDYFSLTMSLSRLVESRFIERFLEFWGFVTIDPKGSFDRDRDSRKVCIQPLLGAVFHFTV